MGMMFQPGNMAEFFYGGRTRLWMRGWGIEPEKSKWRFLGSCEGDARLYGKDGVLLEKFEYESRMGLGNW